MKRTAKRFRPWDVDQIWLLAPSVHEFVPEGRLAHFVRDTVREQLEGLGASFLRSAPGDGPERCRIMPGMNSRGALTNV